MEDFVFVERKLQMTTDYALMLDIKGTDTVKSLEAKEKLFQKYEALFNKHFFKFLAIGKELKLFTSYEKEDYMSYASEAFCKALEVIELGPRVSKSGKLTTLDPKKFFFYKTLNGYLLSAGRDLIRSLIKKAQHEVTYTQMEEAVNNNRKFRFVNPGTGRELEIKPQKTYDNPEKNYYKKVWEDIIGDLQQYMKENNYDQRLLDCLIEGKTVKAMANALHIPRKEIEVQIEDLKVTILKMIPSDVSINDLREAI